MRLRFTASLASLALLAVPARALAYDVLAVPCLDSPLTCGTGAVAFSKTDALPIQWSFDTGWVPQGSPVQVHVWADVWANTHVSLAGSLENAWPAVMTLAAPGKKEGGDFGFHYGADFGAQGKVQISVLGQTYSWTGDIPYLPQFDLEVKADQPFDAWGYAPGVKIGGVTMPAQIASVGLSDIIGGSIPGIDGGFALDVAVELDATYVTNRVVVNTTDGKEVGGGSFTTPDGQSSTSYTNGPNIELDVHPEGTVNYDGVVHLIPTFYVTLLGSKWQIPIADIPISFPITSSDWIFDAQRVHFPLPDLALVEPEIDFGEVLVGQKKLVPYHLWNAGEAEVAAAMTSSNPAIFPVYDTSTNIDPGVTNQVAVRFIPEKAGVFTAQLLVASNDPNAPMQTILLKGTGKGPPAPPPAMDEPQLAEPSSCGCRTAGEEGRGAPLQALAVAAMLGLARRRRQRA
jgi:MYXO-CTERM domain-containing protein